MRKASAVPTENKFFSADWLPLNQRTNQNTADTRMGFKSATWFNEVLQISFKSILVDGKMYIFNANYILVNNACDFKTPLWLSFFERLHDVSKQNY